MNRLPQKLNLDQMQTKWASIINPVLSNPLANGLLLTGIELTSGSNVVNHKLGRKLTGWIIVGINGAANIYDTQASNQLPALTLQLTSDADVICNIWVF